MQQIDTFVKKPPTFIDDVINDDDKRFVMQAYAMYLNTTGKTP